MILGRKALLVAFLQLLLMLPAWAQSIPQQAIPPSILPGREREQFTPPPAPLSRPATTFVQMPDGLAPAEAAGVKLRIKSVTVEGSTVYSAADLAPLYADLIGHEVSAADVYAIASKISAKYGQDGYLLARAVVVPQAVDPKGAALRIRVVEDYIEAIEWPAEAARYHDVFTPCLDKIKAERPARTATIERCLLLYNDIPGLTFSSSLKAGTKETGGSILVVTLVEKPFSAAVRIDNHGVQGQGPWEQTTTLAENNRLGLNESLTFTYAGALDVNELQFFGGNYHQVLTADGLAFDFDGSHSFGKPGLASLEGLDFKSQSTFFDGGFTYPVIRSREQNLRLSVLGFAEDASSQALDFPFSNDRLRGIRLRANYDQVDTWFSTVGISQIIGTFSQGIDGLGSTSNNNALASVANGRVDFYKIEVAANRAQALAFGFSLYGAFDGQWAGSALLTAEQCTYGGLLIGRAFTAQTLIGDRCLLELGELRYDVSIPNNPLTQTQLYLFGDHGDLYHVDPAASTSAHLQASSAGAGLRLGWNTNLSADISVSKQFGDASDNNWRVFFVLTANY